MQLYYSIGRLNKEKMIKNYDGLESRMLHNKFRRNRPAGSGEEDC